MTDKLLAELPGILLWALDGLDRLQERGHLLQPSSATEVIEQMEDLASPTSAFLRDFCHLGPGRAVRVSDLYVAWGRWCEEQGQEHPGTLQVFGRNLHAALPTLQITQPRVEGEQVRFYIGVGLRPEIVRMLKVG